MAAQSDPAQVNLGDAATAGLGVFTDGSGATQEEFDGMDYSKVRFVGLSFDSLDQDIKIGDEHTFTVRARCVGAGDEEMKDGHVRHVVKMDVKSVILQEPTV